MPSTDPSYELIMTIRPIVRYPDPRLVISARPVTEFDDTLRELATDLRETMQRLTARKAAPPEHAHG